MARLLHKIAAAAGAALVSAQSATNYSVCVLYVNQTAQQFAYGVVDSPSGTLKQLVSLPQLEIISNGVAAGAEYGKFYAYAADGQQTTTILEVDFLKGTSVFDTISTITPAGSYTGNFFTAELSWDFTRDTLAGVLEGISGPDDNPTWFAIADVDAAAGSANVRLNLTAAEESFKWVKTGCTAYDASNQVFWMIAGLGAAETETVIGYPLTGASSTPIYIPVITGWDIIALEYSAALDGPIALAYNQHSTESDWAWWSAKETDPAGGWTKVFEYPLGELYLGGMGEADVEGNGAIAIAAFEVPAGAKGKKERSVVSMVDLVHGTELLRLNVTDKMVVADLQFCNAPQ